MLDHFFISIIKTNVANASVFTSLWHGAQRGAWGLNLDLAE